MKNGLHFLIKPFITSAFFILFQGKEAWWAGEERARARGECLQTDIKMSRNKVVNYTVRLGRRGGGGVCSGVPLTQLWALPCAARPTWTKWLCQPHDHSWLRCLSVMEGKWSDGRLLAAPSQMAAGTAPRLADNQRTSKLRRVFEPISVWSQEAKGKRNRERRRQ